MRLQPLGHLSQTDVSYTVPVTPAAPKEGPIAAAATSRLDARELRIGERMLRIAVETLMPVDAKGGPPVSKPERDGPTLQTAGSKLEIADWKLQNAGLKRENKGLQRPGDACKLFYDNELAT